MKIYDVLRNEQDENLYAVVCDANMVKAFRRMIGERVTSAANSKKNGTPMTRKTVIYIGQLDAAWLVLDDFIKENFPRDEKREESSGRYSWGEGECEREDVRQMTEDLDDILGTDDTAEE